MSRKQTRKEWIEKFKKVHGNKYDYSETDTDNRDKKGRVKITCPIHGEFWIKPANHCHLRQGCPKCNGGVRSNTEDFIRKSKEMYGEDTFIYDNVNYINNHTNVILECPTHGKFEVTPSNHLNPTLRVGCPYCSNRIHITGIFQELKEKYDDLLHTIEDYYFDEKTKRYFIKIYCKLHGNFEIRLDHILNKKKNICDKCNMMYAKQRILVKNAIAREERDINCTDRYDFIWKSIQQYGLYKFDYCSVNYIDNFTNVKLYCNIHNVYFNTTPIRHLYYNYDCPICCDRKRVSGTQDWIDRKVPKELLEIYDFSKAEYKGVNIPVKLICPKHGEFWRLPHFINKGKVLCLKCNNSFHENELINFLENNNINYDYQRYFEWLGKQSLDFYLSDYNIAIECQGIQHFMPIEYFGGEEAFLITQERDKRKKRLCKENNVELIYFLDKKFNSYMEEDDIYFNNKEDLWKYIQSKLENIKEK